MISSSSRVNKIIHSINTYGSFSEVIKKAAELDAAGITYIDCGLGEASHGLDQRVTQAGIKALNSDKFYYVKPTAGLNELRQNIANKFSNEIGSPVDKDQVVVIPGAELGLDLLFKTYINYGDEVIIFDPFFIPFAAFVLSYGGVPVFVDTYDHNFLPNLKKLEQKITKKTKAIIINSPNNPTGRIYNEKIVKDISDLASKAGILLISDETYRYYDYENVFVTPYKYYPTGTIVVRSFSKEYSMMGYKVGYIIGEVENLEFIKKIQFPGWGASTISSYMANEAIQINDNNSDILNMYKMKRDSLYQGLKGSGLLEYLPEGAFYFCIKVPNGNNVDYALKLAESGLLVVPAFSTKNSHIRLSYGRLKLEKIDEVLSLLKK